MAIIPREDGMLISMMLYADEVKELQKQYNNPEVSEQEMNMAKMLINSMDTPFDPSKYKDKYQSKLRTLIESKISVKKLLLPNPKALAR